MASRGLIVSGFPEGTTEAELTVYFQSRKKSGGGDIAKTKMEEGRRAVITFEEEGAAERVCERKSHNLKSTALEVSLLEPMPQARHAEERSHSTTDYNRSGVPSPEGLGSSSTRREISGAYEHKNIPADSGTITKEASCKISVTDLPEETSEDDLFRHFESRRSSSGGLVTDVELNQECNTAIVTFESAEVAKRVAKFKDHVLHNHPVTVSLLREDELELIEEASPEHAERVKPERCLNFRVTGLSRSTSEESLSLYFENSRRSGGGEIQKLNIFPDEGVAELSFVEVADYDRLVGEEHHLRGDTLSIEIQEPEVEVPLDPRALYVDDLNPETTDDELLKLYLEKFSNVEVEHVQFGCSGNALVTFKSPPDFDQMIDKVNSYDKGLKGSLPRVRRSPVCLSIKVTGLSDQTNAAEILSLYFESKKSSGGEVDHVDYDEGSDSAIVYFKDVKTVQSVLGKQDHSLFSMDLALELYHPILEDGPRNQERGGRKKRQAKLQKQLAVDRDIVSFIEEFHQDELKNLLESVKVTMHVPDKSAGSVVVCSCPVEPGIHVQSWKERVKAIEDFLNAFTKTSIDLEGDVAAEVQKRKHETDLIKESEQVKIIFLDSGSSVHFIGRERDVSEAIARFQNVARSIEEDLLAKRTLTQSKDKDIPEDKLRLLEMSGYCLELEKKRRYLKIDVDAANGQIEFSGPGAEIKEAKAEIAKFLMPTKTLVVEVPERCSRILFSPEGYSHTKKHFQERSIVATVSPGAPGRRNVENEAVILGLDDANARQAESFLRTEFKEFSSPLKVGQLPVTSDIKWQELVSQMQFQSLVSVNIESNTLWVSGVSSEASRSFQQLRDFLDHNTILERVIQMPKGCSRFLVTVWREEVDKIARKNSTTWSHTSDGERDGDSGITFSGNNENLTKCVEEIQNLASKIKCDSISIDKPGMGKLFSKVSGRHLLRGVEDKNRCTIERIMDVDEATDGTPPLEEGARGKGSDLCCTCSYVTLMGRKISVYKDDLTKHPVDAIVNAANARLRHSGGLAAAVVREGGQEIQEECDDHIRQRGAPLLDGQVYVSKPGKLPCKRIIHAVGPKWDEEATTKRLEGEKTRPEIFLAHAIRNCLEKASSLSTIAIPAVSSGVYDFPLDLCASVIIDTAVTFFQENPTCMLSEVHLVDNDDRMVARFTDEMREKFGQEDTFHEHGTTTIAAKLVTNATLPTPRRRLAARPKDDLTTAEGIKISVRAGDLSNEKADVLVGSCGSTLELKNPCARALSQAAGPGLQQECRAKGTVKEGDIAKVGPHGLQQLCKAVYFAVCSSWNGGKGEKVLIDLLNKCFTEAHQNNMASIALSSIGTGLVLSFPPATVARVYFDQAMAFSRKYPRTSLKEIRFIPFDKDIETVTAFAIELSKRTSGGCSPTHNTVDSARRRRHRDPVFSIVKERASNHLQMNVGNICFQVQAGDIIKENTDAIVVVSNSDLDLNCSGGAGAAILGTDGGTAVQTECAAMNRQSPGAVVRTSAGSLKAKFIFHVVPSARQTIVKESIVNCLKLADSSNISSISFPAVGTGNLRMDAKDCAELLLTSVETFNQQNPKSLQLVRIVIYQPQMVDAFRSVMRKRSGQKSSSRIFGMMKSAKKAASNYLRSDRKETSQVPADIKLSLKVFAGTRLDVDRATKAIREMMDEHCKQKVIEKQEISLLSEDHERRICAAGLTHGTGLTIERAVGRIEIRGNPEDILEVNGKIQEILDEIKEEERKRYQEEMLAQTVEWEFEDGGKFEQYPKEINFKIETAFNKGKSGVAFTLNEDPCEIDFTKMEEICPSAGSVIAVRRRDVKDIAVPAHWVPQPTDDQGKEKKVFLVKLNPNASEYQMVEEYFQNPTPTHFKIVSIDRVQNPGLNGIYETKKAKMDEGKGSNEMKLFHGTAGKNVDNINSSGFNRSYSGVHAVMYGSGVYFAVKASYSARSIYSPQDAQGLRYMYLAKVLVGEYAVGKQGLIVPPSKNDPNNPTESYDTAVDRVPNPNIFVTFYDWQCYPEYLITFK